MFTVVEANLAIPLHASALLQLLKWRHRKAGCAVHGHDRTILFGHDDLYCGLNRRGRWRCLGADRCDEQGRDNTGLGPWRLLHRRRDSK